jgi:transcriptional regulator with XRE-family HTH domain
VSGEDRVLAIDQDGIGEAEPADAVRDLPDLLLRMGSRVLRPWSEGRDGEVFDVPGHGTLRSDNLTIPYVTDSLAPSTRGIYYRQPGRTEGMVMSLATRIAELRRQRNESLQQVADAVGVSKAHIWDMERGRADNPAMGLVTRLADHFGVSVAFLVGEDVEAKDADPELQRMFRQAKQLDDRERAILDEMMKSLLRNRAGK